MEVKKLDFAETLKDAISIGVKNAPSVIATIFLYVITVWIPYLNIGTTIAMQLLPVELSKGNVINPLYIFEAKYRRHMDQFFILMALQAATIMAGFVLFYIPGIIIALAFSLSYYFLLEKGKNPLDALKASYEATLGNKWTMFLATLLVAIVIGVVAGLLNWVCGMIGVGIITFLVMLVVIVCAMSIMISLSASFWKQLKDNVA